MAGSRFRDDGRRIDDFLDRILVVCPRCGKRADVVLAPGAGESPRAGRVSWASPRRLACAHCGLAKTHDKPTAGFGRGVDPYFALPLVLSAPAAGHVIWAYNLDHLDHLLAFVEATIRERPPATQEAPAPPSSLLEKMPGWFGAASNRISIGRVLRALRESVAED